MVGQAIDRYTLVEKLGSGGMGDVFKGHHTSLDQYRAIKLLPSHLSRSPALVERFLREARRCAALCHPNIVRLEHVGEQDGQYYMVMDYLPGASLRQLVDDHGALPVERVIRIAVQVSRALAHAHEHGVIHRDVKPSNIMVGAGDQAVLTDFGVARGMEGDEPGLTAVGMTVGTPEYMSPEQIRGAPLDGRSDLYSLGVVLYESLTGELPFTARSMASVKRQHLEKPPDPPSFHNPELPEALDRLVLIALAKDPADRFASARELADALALLQSGPTSEAERLSTRIVARQAPTMVRSADPTWSSNPTDSGHGSRTSRESPTVDTTPEAGPPLLEGELLKGSESVETSSRRNAENATAATWPLRLNPPFLHAEQRKKLFTGGGIVLAVLVLLALLQGLGESSGRRFTAEKAVDPRTGREYGMVRAHGVPIFVITQSFGELKPAQRAEKAAQRLQQWVEGRGGKSLEPEMLSVVENHRGETLLARRRQGPPGKDPEPEDVIVTVDADTASAYVGASRTSLALWWRDLLRDQLRLSRGKPPVSTFNTRYGRVLDRVYQGVESKRKGDWVPVPELESVVEDLPRDSRDVLDTGWRTVPASWKGTSAEAEPIASGVLPILRKSVTASDALRGFPPSLAIDGDTSTGWQTEHGKQHHGRDHWIKVQIPPGTAVSELQLREGQRSNPQFQLHIKQARATFSDGSSRRIWRKSPTDPLRIGIPAKRTRWIKLQVEQVFAHHHPHESHLYVSEVRLWGP